MHERKIGSDITQENNTVSTLVKIGGLLIGIDFLSHQQLAAGIVAAGLGIVVGNSVKS